MDSPSKETLQTPSSEHLDAERDLDWYDLMLLQTFPASDALPLWNGRRASAS